MLNYFHPKINYNDKLARNHFLKIVLPKAVQNKVLDDEKTCIMKFTHSVTQDPLIEHLNQHLMSNFGTPPISTYTFLFITWPEMPIHIDALNGSPATRANLNLPLSGWEGNLMNYYTENPGYTPNPPPGSKMYYDPNQVTLCDQFETTGDWVLVRADRPHNVTNMDLNNPRAVLIIQFKDNPSFEHLYKCLVGEPLSV